MKAKTGKISALDQDARVGIITDDEKQHAVFLEVDLHGLKWESLRKGKMVTYIDSPVSGADIRVATLVSPIEWTDGLGDAVSRGWTVGEVASLFSQYGRGVIRGPGNVSVFFGKAAVLPPAVFGDALIGKTVEFQGFTDRRGRRVARYVRLKL